MVKETKNKTTSTALVVSKKKKVTKPNGNRNLSAAIHSVCSLADPFCDHAIASKWPDSSTANTVTERISYMYQPINNAAGNGGWVFRPSATTSYNPCTEAAGTFTLGATAGPGYTTLYSTYGSNYRIVSAGFRLVNTASMTNSGGVIFAGRYMSAGAAETIAMSPATFSDSAVMPLKHGFEFATISRPMGTDARAFNSTTASQEWESIAVMWMGGTPNVSSISIHVVINIEFNLADHPLQSLATPSPPENPALTKAVTKVQKSLGTIAEGTLSRFANKVVDMAATAVGAYFGGPAGAAIGHSAYDMIQNAD